MSNHNFEISDVITMKAPFNAIFEGTVAKIYKEGIEVNFVCGDNVSWEYIYIPNHMLYTLTNLTKQQKSKDKQMKEQANKLLTPCEQLGYKVGDKFVVLKTTVGFTKGQTVYLYKDDGTSIPLFEGANTRFALCGEHDSGAFLRLDYVKPFKESNTNQEENKMTEVNQQNVANKEPKNKPKTQAQLVFTYTNGKRYVVRGLQRVKVFLNGDKFQVDYTHSTYDGVKHQTSNVSVYVTNELVKVEKINTDNSVEIVLDLSSATAKAQGGAKKPRGNARSKEQWEAMVEAKKAQEERNKAFVEAKVKELAEKMLKEGKI